MKRRQVVTGQSVCQKIRVCQKLWKIRIVCKLYPTERICERRRSRKEQKFSRNQRENCQSKRNKISFFAEFVRVKAWRNLSNGKYRRKLCRNQYGSVCVKCGAKQRWTVRARCDTVLVSLSIPPDNTTRIRKAEIQSVSDGLAELSHPAVLSFTLCLLIVLTQHVSKRT